MSEMEARKGRIKKIQHVNGVTSLDAMIMEIVKELNSSIFYEECLEDFEDVEEAFMEVLYHNGCEKYKILDNDLYEVLDDVELDPNGYSEIMMNEDGSISYFALWYNGGGDLSEILERHIKKERKLAKNPNPDGGGIIPPMSEAEISKWSDGVS